MSAEVISLLSFARSKALGQQADATVNQREVVGHVNGDYFVWFEHQVRGFLRVELARVTDLRLITKAWRHSGMRCRHCAQHGMDVGMDDAGELMHVTCPHCGQIERLWLQDRTVKVRGAHEVRCRCCGVHTISQYAICDVCRDEIYTPAGCWCPQHGPVLEPHTCLVCDIHEDPKGAA